MIGKWLKRILSKNKDLKNDTNTAIPLQPFNSNIVSTKHRIQEIFGYTSDLMTENITFGNQSGLLVYLNTVSNMETISSKILLPLTEVSRQHKTINSDSEWRSLSQEVFSGAQHSFIEYEQQIVHAIINGHAVLFMGNFTSVLSIKVQLFEQRAIEEPTTQTIIRGPKEGFNENVQTSLSLIRKRVKNPALRFEEYTIGSETSTPVFLAYIDGILNKKILEEIRKRLNRIQTNAIFDSGMLEELIVDKTFTPFPLTYNTERSDTIAAHLISGKFAIFVDGSPFVLSGPVTFSDFISVSEDQYQPFPIATFVRFIRYLAFLIALLLPSFYVGIITYHHEMIPTQLLMSVITQREGIPFPAVIEALLMEITFEILREAGVRMPRAVGGTISIVGGLVIGQAAVEAGIVSNIMVIVVSLTAIASFVAPVYSFAVSTRILRFVFVIVSSIFGLYGVFLGMIFLVAHITSLRSYSVPYLSPIAPLKLRDQGDIMLRLPLWASKKRPSYLQTESPDKQPNVKSPTPPEKGAENS